MLCCSNLLVINQLISLVKQIVPSETQENGQKESKRSDHEDEEETSEGRDRISQEEKTEGSLQVSMETEPSSPGQDVDMKTGENYRITIHMFCFFFPQCTSMESFGWKNLELSLVVRILCIQWFLIHFLFFIN